MRGLAATSGRAMWFEMVLVMKIVSMSSSILASSTSSHSTCRSERVLKPASNTLQRGLEDTQNWDSGDSPSAPQYHIYLIFYSIINFNFSSCLHLTPPPQVVSHDRPLHDRHRRREEGRPRGLEDQLDNHADELIIARLRAAAVSLSRSNLGQPFYC